MVATHAPPALAGPDVCVVSAGGTVVTCQGNQSAGIASGTDFTAPPVTTLNINNLTQDITPAANDGVYFYSPNTIVVTSDTGAFAVRTSGNYNDGFYIYSTVGAVTVTNSGTITTQGDYAYGIDAYSITGAVNVTQTGDITTQGINAYGIEASSAFGPVTVTQTGNVTTTGPYSKAIYAFTNLSSNVVITNTGDVSTAGAYADGITGASYGGDITITHTGDITVTGSGADGIDTTNAIGVGTTTVIVNAGSTVTGGPVSGDGIEISDGLSSRILNFGTVTTLGDNAIETTSGNDIVDNFGTVTGSVDMRGGANTFNNRAGGIFNSGPVAIIGAGNTLSNAGTLSPGGTGTVQTTALTGNIVQTGTGTFVVDIDPSAGTGDLVTVTGTANLAGTVQAAVVNPAPGTQSVTILSAAGGTTNNGLGLVASPALQASLSFPNANDVVLTYSIDFTVGGLNRNQTALAQSLNSAAAAGTGGLEPVLSALLNNVFSIGDYRNALNQLLPEVYLNTETGSLFSSEDFIDNLFSCRLAGDNHTALDEGECLWARGRGRILDRDSDFQNIGFDETAGRLAAGGQISVAPNWFAGFALGYERASLDTDSGAETDSNRFHAGLSLKRQAGSFYLGAAISGGLYGNHTERAIGFGGAGGFNATAESNYAIKTLSAQARAAYLFEFRDWFAKPLVDINVTYLSRDGVTETGAGAANLAIAGNDDAYFSITPALEIGGDFALSETAQIRPYARAGVSFYTGSDHALTASFVNAPAGTNAFSITSDFDDVFADVAAGATAFFENGSTLGLSYEGLISSDTQVHGISLKGSIAF
ncbi:MAG: autotransporter domain-containing protein [Pseudomonadota bacterium]